MHNLNKYSAQHKLWLEHPITRLLLLNSKERLSNQFQTILQLNATQTEQLSSRISEARSLDKLINDIQNGPTNWTVDRNLTAGDLDAVLGLNRAEQ